MAPHSSTLAWKIPWTEEPGGLQSMGSQRGGHNWAPSLSLFTFMHRRRKWQLFLPGESQGREPDGLLSMGSHRVGHDWCDLAAAAVELQGIKWAQRNQLYFYIPVMKILKTKLKKKKNPICKSPKSKISKDKLNQGDWTLYTNNYKILLKETLKDL